MQMTAILTAFYELANDVTKVSKISFLKIHFRPKIHKNSDSRALARAAPTVDTPPSPHSTEITASDVSPTGNNRLFSFYFKIQASIEYGVRAEVYDRDIAITVLTVFFLTWGTWFFQLYILMKF